jgi:hypothetical protein
MRLFGRSVGMCKAHATDPNSHNSLPFRIAAYTAAVALITCGASQNVSHSWALGAARSEISGYILAGGALAAAIMSPVCISVALTGRGMVVRLAALFLGLWCLTYGLSRSLGFIASAKDAGISERQVSSGCRRRSASEVYGRRCRACYAHGPIGTRADAATGA